MTEASISSGILAFSHQLANGRAGESGLTVARSRRWLDENGRVTAEGRALFEALVAQRETRTSFRYVL